MAISTQIQNLNLIPGKSAPVVVHLSQGNVGNTVQFYLYDGDNPYYPTNVSIAVHGVRADNTVFGPYTVSVTSGSNLVSFTIVTAMTSVNGAAIGELVLTDNNQNQVGSANFGMLVEATPYSSSVTYEDDLSIYQRILAYVQSVPAGLQSQISAEASTRSSAVSNLQSQISAEASARKTADTNLQSQISAEVSSEASARTAADTNLQSQINQIVAPSGEAPSAAEVQNARIGADGVTYSTLGDAIRTQNNNIKNSVSPDINSIANIADELYENSYKQTASVEAVRYQYNNIVYAFVAGKRYKIKVTRSEAATDCILIASANGDQYVDTNIAAIIPGSTSITFAYVPSANASNLRITYAESKTGITYTAEITDGVELKENTRVLTKLVGTPKYGLMQNGVYYEDETSNHYQTMWYDVSDVKAVNIDYNSSYYHDAYVIIGTNGETIKYLLSTANSHFSETIPLRPDAKYLVLSANSETKLQYAKVTAEKKVKSTNLLGKKIVWFGTSIPAGGNYGYGNINSYPMRLGAMLGATVYNESVGSSTVHCRRSDHVSTSNPYGFIEQFDPVSRSLANSLEMQEWVINHYTEFNNHPDTLTDTDKDFIRSCSYERKLDKYLTKETEPDLWVFDHGHNEYLGSENEYSETDPYSAFTFQGAMNFLINRIKQYNPYAKIVIIGDYDKQRYPLIATYQEKVAERWEFPFYKLYDEMGWNNKTLVTTGFWRNGFWQTKNGTEHEVTYINVWCADDLHPHSDTTGKALDYYARMLFEHFRQIEVN